MASRHLLQLALIFTAACSGASEPEVHHDDEPRDDAGQTDEAGPVTSSSGGPDPSGAGGSDGSTGSSLHGSGGGGASRGTSGSTSGAGGGGGAPPNSDCCTPSMTGGCADTPLNACVCAIDSYCCDTAWDAICVSLAQNNCDACENAQCTDLGVEPSETEQTAHNLTGQPITDCDSAGGSINGTIDGPSDVDWYVYGATDELACVVDPARTLQSISGGIRMCKYFECHLGPTVVTCPIGTTAENSPDGRSGCCGTYGFQVDIDCTDSWSDDAWVYLRLDQPNAPSNSCNHYAVGYHY